MKKDFKREEGRYVGNGYYNYDLCKACKGKRCCAHYGCMYSPEDFIVLGDTKYTHEQRLIILTELLKQGKISIDMCWGTDLYWGPLNPLSKRPDIEKMLNGEGYLYLRARNKNRPVVDFQKFMTESNYPCINWNPEKGCCLSEEERPYCGRMLNPIVIKDGNGYEDYRCEMKNDAETETIKLWARHQELMYDLYRNIVKLNIK